MRLGKHVVLFCYFLEDSARYRRVKSACYDVLANPQSRVRPYFDLLMIALVLASVFLLVFGVRHELGEPARLFEHVAVSIFFTEYLLRAWLYNDSRSIVIEHYERAEFLGTPFRLAPALKEMARKKWEYATTPLAIIDLLAILPSYRPIRLLRILLLFRLFKLFRYARSINEFIRVLAEKRFEFLTLGIFIGFVIFASSTAIYIFEGGVPGSLIGSFFDAVYWSLITISTVGYGDITPTSTEGRVVTLVLIVSGIGVLSFSTSIIVSAFNEKMRGLRKLRVFAEVEKMRNYVVLCGYGRVGQVLADRLAMEREPFVIIEQDETRVEHAKEHGYLVVQGDASQHELLENIGIEKRAKTVLCITGDDVVNVFITLSTRHMRDDIRIISRANQNETIPKLKLAGADHVVSSFEIVGLAAAEYVGQPVAFEAIYGILSGERGVNLEPIRIPANSLLEQRRVGDIDFLKYRVILFGVITGREEVKDELESSFELEVQRFYFNPPSDFVLRHNDILVVFGHEFSIRHFREQLESSSFGPVAA